MNRRDILMANQSTWESPAYTSELVKSLKLRRCGVVVVVRANTVTAAPKLELSLFRQWFLIERINTYCHFRRKITAHCYLVLQYHQIRFTMENTNWFSLMTNVFGM